MAENMKTITLYAAGAVAFAAATVSFIQGNTWPGILATLAGILAVGATLGGDKK